MQRMNRPLVISEETYREPESEPSDDHDAINRISNGDGLGVVRSLVTFWMDLTWSEISGGLGDLGTFIPLYVALSRQGSIYAVAALFLGGLANIVTGLYWDIPMPVQPMKSIAAIALVDGLTRPQVTAAGIWMGLLLLILGASGLIECINRVVPMSIVSGIQIGVGISLAIKACHMIAALSWFNNVDCLVLAFVCTLACLYLLREPNGNASSRSQKPAIGLYLFLLGAVIAVSKLISDERSFAWSPTPPVTWAVKGVSWRDWRVGLLEGALPQLPLTVLNSVISVCCLAHSLFPEKRRGESQTDAVISRRAVCLSIGLMNLLLCPLGAMPSCHGAGGLAGQHKFGARRGVSVVFLGAGKIILALTLGGSIVQFLDKIPTAILGVMLAIAGHELALTGFASLVKSGPYSEASTDTLRRDTAIATLTAIVILSTQKAHYGALVGWAAHMIYGDGVAECQSQRRDEDRSEYSAVSLSTDLNEQDVDRTRIV